MFSLSSMFSLLPQHGYSKGVCLSLFLCLSSLSLSIYTYMHIIWENQRRKRTILFPLSLTQMCDCTYLFSYLHKIFNKIGQVLIIYFFIICRAYKSSSGNCAQVGAPKVWKIYVKYGYTWKYEITIIFRQFTFKHRALWHTKEKAG